MTVLLAAIYDIPVKDKNYNERRIRISFNPLTREFAVWTEAYRRNTEWISEISAAFQADDDEQNIETNINNLLNLLIYTLLILRINMKAGEEDVAEVFVRVNSGGQKLTEKNFIETLLTVYDNDVHDQIDKFCADSHTAKDGTSYNFIFKVDLSHLIRMAVAVGFHRARLRYAYMLMRGKDLDTGKVTVAEREKNLG